MDCNKKYKKLVNELIDKSFPLLKGFKLFVIELKIFNWNWYSAGTGYFIFFGSIILHPKVRKYPSLALKGLLVHELSHLDIIIRKTFLEKIGFAFSWAFTKKGKAENEKAADMLTIEKGYGKNLLQLVKIIEKQKNHLKHRAKHGYLTSNKIKKLIKGKR